MEIITSGTSSYQIITPGRHFPVENLAAENLQEGLYRLTGARLPVRWAHQRLPDLPAILVGSAGAGEAGLWEKDWYEVSPQSADLVLRGANRRGTHYAVNAFLESLGTRFWGPDHIVYPRLEHVALPASPTRSTAAIGYRHVFYPTAQVPEWAIRWKLNVHDGHDQRWGPNAIAHSWGHSFEALVPVEIFFGSHPEYFSLVDGQRRSRGQQLCCTNPAVAEVASESMARWIAQNPDRRIFAVAMNDWEGWCECPDCANADAREGGHIGQILTLVNQVAERFPDRIISTLAYWWAVDPPRQMRARDNVLIVLCHNEGCFTHALEACELNERFLERLKKWKDKASHILLWDYYVNYHSYLMPTPNLERIENDIRLYRDYGVAGMFTQGSACRGGQFEGLRQYLLARLLWDPDLSAWGIAEEWLAGVYGMGAGGRILEYLQMLNRHVRQNHVHMPSFGAGQVIQNEIFTPEILAQGKTLWEQAEAAAEPEAREEVFAARAPEMCARLFHTGMTYRIKGNTLAPEPAPDLELRDRFVRAAILGNAAHLREDDASPEAFRRHYGRVYQAVILENPALRAVIVPEMGGRIYSLHHKGLGIELLRLENILAHINFFPYEAGYEFAIEPVWKGRGTAEAYQVMTQTGSESALRAVLPGEIAIQHQYILQGSSLTIRHEVSNLSQAAVTVSPVTHPEWAYAAFGDSAQLSIRQEDGTAQTVTLNPEGRESRDLEFKDGVKPNGLWQLTSAVHPFIFQEAFAADAILHTRVNFSLARGSVNLQLCFKPKKLLPGETIACALSWQWLAQ